MSAASLHDEREALSRAIGIVEDWRTAPDPADPSIAIEALAALDSEPTLATWEWLRAPLLERPVNAPAAEQRLRAAAAALEAERSARINPEAARAALDQVLLEPRFHPTTWRDLTPGWLLPVVLLVIALLEWSWNIVRWPVDRLLDLLPHLLTSPLIVVLALAAIVGIVLLYRAGLRAALVRQAEIDAGPDALPPTAVEALAAAQRQAAVGRYREACHFVLLSTLLGIEEHGEARFDPSATNREHLRRANAAGPAVGRALSPLVAAFDEIWYGGDAVTETNYRGLIELAVHVREAAA